MSEGETRVAGFAEVEEILLRAEIRDCRPLWYSSNYVYVANLADGDSGLAAVYKPLRGEAPLWDFPDGLYQREVAAYRFARLLDWPFIPPTVMRDGPEGVGSLQLFVPHDPQSHFFTQREDPALVPQLQRMAVFDAAANNADRKGGHCLLDASGRVWGIDHGLCFHQQYKLRSVIWDWAGEPVPGEWLEDLERARCALEERTPEALGLIGLLSPAEVATLCRRMDELIAARRFPLPGPGRHYPWPLV